MKWWLVIVVAPSSPHKHELNTRVSHIGESKAVLPTPPLILTRQTERFGVAVNLLLDLVDVQLIFVM